MPHRRRYDQEAPYPEAMRRTVLEFFGVNRGHVWLAGIMVFGGGGTETLMHSRLSALEKKGDEHAAILSTINERLGKLDSAVAVLQSQGNASASQTQQLAVNIQDLTKAVYRMQGMARVDRDKVSLNQ